jgi:hypothetical protein
MIQLLEQASHTTVRVVIVLQRQSGSAMEGMTLRISDI